MRQLALCLAATLTIACQPEPDEPDPCPSDPPLTWENFGKGHLDQHCNGCHGSLLRPEQRNDAPVGVDFDTWGGTERFGERIWVRTLETQDMPPLGGPTPEELATFEEWLRCEVLAEPPE